MASFEPVVHAAPVDGATAYSRELRGLLGASGLQIQWHGFEELLRWGTSKRFFDDVDAVVASVGPYAFLYLWLRKASGISTPVIRDVHAGAWTGYLLQEWLCDPLTENGDVIVFPSAYSRDLYTKHFPRTAAIAKMVVAHPRFHGRRFPPWRPKKIPRGIINIGVLGRLSNDKNVLDAVRGIKAYSQRANCPVICNVLGGEYDLTVEQLKFAWVSSGGAKDSFRYWGAGVPDSRVQEFFSSIDVLLFTSTSNAEALGRVVLEARHACVRVCIADHAAAREVAAKDSLIPVVYRRDMFSCDDGCPSGLVNSAEIAAALERVIGGDNAPPMNDEAYFADPFIDGLSQLSWSEPGRLSPGTQSYSLELPRPLSMCESMQKIDEIVAHLLEWSYITDMSSRLRNHLLSTSTNPARSIHFLELLRERRLNYADLSGFPFQLAQLCSFHPRAVLVTTSSIGSGLSYDQL